jgi:chemotaxis family two-component system sensor kinase Cph1
VTAAWSPPVSLDNCAAEPIHVPGAIQPHGGLVAVTEPDLRIAVVSANVADWFDVPPGGALGAGLGAVVGEANRAVIDEARRSDWVQRFDDVPLDVGGRSLVATLHRSDGYLVVEVEDSDAEDHHSGSIVREAAMALQRATGVVQVAAHAARWIRSLTGFDRVMVYRFDAEWNGEVIAEERRGDLNSFLGLHYPATDIPAQARELYRRNWLRLIPDIRYRPVPLDPPVAHDSHRPLDLSTSTLRSVSPIHVEYLGNMGVTASMSVSIVIQGELWGLIACHHYAGPHRPGVAARNAAEFLAQLISLRVAETEDAELRARSLELAAIADHVAEALHAAPVPDIVGVLRSRQREVLDVVRATGAVVITGDEWVRVGLVPPDDVVRRLVDEWPLDDAVLRTDHTGLHGAEAAASGALVFPLTNDRREVVAWFRPELVRQVDWGGDPHNAKLYAAEGDDVRLSPRKSFDLWREVVRGRSEPWHESDVRAGTRFTRHLAGALLRRERHHAGIASDLQRVMRPASVPVVPGWEIDVHDEPAGTGQIGGDWFDVFDAGGGLLVAVVGDVAGHGLRAAAEMAQLRNSLRAYLLDDPDPPRALERLDVLMARVLPGTIATAVCAVIDTATGTVRMSHAGHVPALVATTPAAAAFVADAAGDMLLGVTQRPRRAQVATLPAGGALVLYSDGLIEQPRRPIDDGLEILRRTVPGALARPAGTNVAAWIAEQLHDERHVDDTSVLVLRNTG